VSARTDLVAALTAGLPATYRVVGAPDVPDQVDVGEYAVRCWQTEVTPGPQLGGLTMPLVLWVLTGKQKPGTVDDVLDVAVLAVLDVLHGLEWVQWTRAERGVMTREDGSGLHGWRFDLTAYGRIETTED